MTFGRLGVLAFALLGSLLGTAQSGIAQDETLVLSMPYEPKFLNVNYDSDLGAPYQNMNIYSKLITYSYANSELHGDLAESWDLSSDGLTYTFKLRQGVKWHDGAPFTAADVVWTIEDILREGTAAVSFKMIQDIASIEAPDDFTVVITLKAPNSAFLANVASYYGFNILPRHLYEGTDVRANPLNLAPVGTGPFKFAETVPGSHTVMVANEDYFGEGPFVDVLVFRTIPNLATAISALEAGETAYSIASPPPGEVPRLAASPGIKVDSSNSPIVMWFGFNFDRPEFKDVRVRRAIAQAINREEIAEKLYRGLVKPADGYYTSAVGWANNPDVKQPAFDPAAAEQLLDEAGYPRGADGIRFRTSYTAFTFSIWGGPEQAQMIRQYLADVGIDVTVKNTEFSLFNEVIRTKRDYDMVNSGGLRGPDPSEFINFVGSKGSRNVMPFVNQEVDALFAQDRVAVTQDERKALHHKIQELVAADVPVVNLIEYAYARPYRSEWTGWWWQEDAIGRVGQDMYNLVQRQK
ncbi:MAG: ABC transporter substrate-binding protein [Devosia sp.]